MRLYFYHFRESHENGRIPLLIYSFIDLLKYGYIDLRIFCLPTI